MQVMSTIHTRLISKTRLQVIYFLIFGAINTLIAFFTYKLFIMALKTVNIFSAEVITSLSYALSYILAIFTGYFLHGKYTFSAAGYTLSNYIFAKFVLMHIVLLLYATVTSYTVKYRSGLSDDIIWILVTTTVWGINFIVSKFAVFKKGIM